MTVIEEQCSGGWKIGILGPIYPRLEDALQHAERFAIAIIVRPLTSVVTIRDLNSAELDDPK